MTEELHQINAARLLYSYPGAGIVCDGPHPLECDGDVADGAALPKPGHYRTSVALGLVQLGAHPVFDLSVRLS